MAATVRAPVARPTVEVPPVIPNVGPRDASMAAAVAGLTGEPVAPPAPSAPNAGVATTSKPKAGVDLAEIDRYLEGLGKL